MANLLTDAQRLTNTWRQPGSDAGADALAGGPLVLRGRVAAYDAVQHEASVYVQESASTLALQVVEDTRDDQFGPNTDVLLAVHDPLAPALVAVIAPWGEPPVCEYTCDEVDALLAGKADVGHVHALSSLADVVIGGPSDGQVLRYDAASGRWRNAAL
jgi:hypothetical protein